MTARQDEVPPRWEIHNRGVWRIYTEFCRAVVHAEYDDGSRPRWWLFTVCERRRGTLVEVINGRRRKRRDAFVVAEIAMNVVDRQVRENRASKNTTRSERSHGRRQEEVSNEDTGA